MGSTPDTSGTVGADHTATEEEALVMDHECLFL